MKILAVNAGSSSLKLALFDARADGETCLARGSIDAVGTASTHLTWKDESGRVIVDHAIADTDHTKAFRAAWEAIERAGLPTVEAVGHRLVHGGQKYSSPVLLDAATRAGLASLKRFAPLHLPIELALVDEVTRRAPTVRQFLCFDTGFHHDLPEVATRLPLPRRFFDDGVRKYGFHGLSCESVVATIGAAELGRAVVAHLGSGASMTAIANGRSVDTTMGLTPTGGLMMGTRVGDLDPGVLLDLMTQYRYDARTLEKLIDAESGLLGVSGETSDVRRLLETSATDPHAREAIEIFCRTASKFVGALVTTLGGLDTLVFTGGIGENASEIRARICDRLGHLGVAVDPARNEAHAREVSPVESRCRVLAVVTDEERVIAHHGAQLLR